MVPIIWTRLVQASKLKTMADFLFKLYYVIILIVFNLNIISFFRPFFILYSILLGCRCTMHKCMCLSGT